MKRQDSPNEQGFLMSDRSGRAPSYSSFSNTNNQDNENENESNDSDGFLHGIEKFLTPKPEIKVYNISYYFYVFKEW